MDKKTVTTISYLSRLRIDKEKEEKIVQDLDNIIEFVDQLNDADTSDVEPLTNPLEKTAKTRSDQITAKNIKKEKKSLVIATNDQEIIDISDILVDLNSKPKPLVVKQKK